MKKIFLYIFLCLSLIVVMTGCSTKDDSKIVTPIDDRITEEKEFIETYDIKDSSNLAFEYIGSLNNGISLFNIYDKTLDKKTYTFKVLDMVLVGESTGQISKYDLFAFNDGKVYPLEIAVENNYINSEELSYIIPEKMKQQETETNSNFGQNLVSELYENKILDNTQNMIIYPETINNMLSLNHEEYEWIEMSISKDVMHIEDVIVFKYQTESQKNTILDKIKARKYVTLESQPNNIYYQNVYDKEFIMEKDNVVVYCAAESSSEAIKNYLTKYFK